MPRVPVDYIPSLRLHRQSGQAIVTLSGKDHYLGKFGTPAAQVQYHELVAQWLAGGRKAIGVAAPSPIISDKPAPVTVVELCDAFQRHADVYYKRPGKRSNAADVFKLVLRDVRDLFGSTLADDFTALMLREVRNRWIARDYVRKSINQYAGYVRRVFRWGVAEELVDVKVVQKLKCLDPLTEDKSKAKESTPVKPVPLAYVDAIRTYVARPVWALIQLQANTGARGDELFRLRAIDIDTSGPIWTYRPLKHKTSHKGKMRLICFGPKSQELLRPFLSDRPVDAMLFNPREANAQRKAATATKGKPRRPNQHPNAKKTARVIREAYDDTTYRSAIQRACKVAGVPRWHPHQLRHNFTTDVDRRHGVEAARAAAGHSSIDTTLIYAERDSRVAMKIAAEIG